ncbi:MAG: Ig-like domain-containing protein [Acidimicrobiia bacterium]|nr:Ig-like domain-containing protein [Acidimicrobiia bacterium]
MTWTRDFSRVVLIIAVWAVIGAPLTAAAEDAPSDEIGPFDSAQLELDPPSEAPLPRASISLSGAYSDEGEMMTFELEVTGYIEPFNPITGVLTTFGKGDGFSDGGEEPTAIQGDDYSYMRKHFSFYEPGVQYFPVATLEDGLVEGDEWFILLLTPGPGTIISGDIRTRGWIVDDDSGTPSSLSIDDAAVIEGDSGTQTAPFIVTLSPAASSTVTVDYSTCGVGCDPAATATAGDDYAIAKGTLTFAPGETSKPIPVGVNGDTAIEPDETYFVYLLDPVNATIVRNPGLGTILDDDSPGNHPPLANGDGPYTVHRGAVLTLPAPGVLGNDADGDGDALTAIKASDPSHGTLGLGADGSFTYTHDGSASVSDSFTYQASDGIALSNSATVMIEVIDVLPGELMPSSVGLVDPSQGQWHLRDYHSGAVTSFYFGNPGDMPVFGDWNCDGVATPGLFRQSDAFAYLSNANRSQVADIRFFFGNPSDVPLAGDFNGDGCDTLSIYRPAEQRFYIMNRLGENEGGLGAADDSFAFGNPGDKPVVGDWDGDGIDEIGLHRESTGYFYYRNTLDAGFADSEFFFGDPGDRFVAGDWGLVDGVETPAVFRPANSTFYFRHTNSPGNADSQVAWGQSQWLPIAGPVG